MIETESLSRGAVKARIVRIVVVVIGLAFLVPLMHVQTVTLAIPQDEWMAITLEMSTYRLDIPIDPDADSSETIEGWVTLVDKRPGETVNVQMYLNSDSLLYGIMNPAAMSFSELGTKYFNLTVYVKEDTGEVGPLKMAVSAFASSLVGNAEAHVELNVYPVAKSMSGTVDLSTNPGNVEPGGTSSGSVVIHNEGSRPAYYDLMVTSDTGEVVKEVRFKEDASLGPGWVRERDFEVEVKKGASPGVYTVGVGLTTVDDTGHPLVLDTFTFDLKVVEGEEESATGPIVFTVLVVVVAIVALLYWRRRS